MKRACLLTSLLIVSVFVPTVVRADDDDDHYRYRNTYGRSRSYYREALVPAKATRRTYVNNCMEGTVIGGLAGAGVGAALTRGGNRWIGVPLGAAAGAFVGCQIDGG
jgi:uncharacterized protein YcfJ